MRYFKFGGGKGQLFAYRIIGSCNIVLRDREGSVYTGHSDTSLGEKYLRGMKTPAGGVKLFLPIPHF